MSEESTEAELRALSKRVRIIEERLAAAAESDEEVPDRATPRGDYWVLDGLRERVGPSAGAVVFAGSAQTGDGPVEWQRGELVQSLQEMGEPELEHVAARLAALGSPVRLRILLSVLQGSTTTAQLTELDDVGTSGQIYHHVRALTAAGWLRTVSRGTVAVPPERVVPAWVALCLAQ